MRFSPEANRPEDTAPDLPPFDEGELVASKGLPEYYRLVEELNATKNQEERIRIEHDMEKALKNSGSF